MVSDLFDAQRWEPVAGFEDLTDVTYHRGVDVPAVRVAFDRPEVRNAFRPHTVDELYRVLDHARQSGDVGCVLLTGNGPSPKDGGWAFCSGGDQRIRGKDRLPVQRPGARAHAGRAGPRGAPAHPRGAAPDPVHAQDRHRAGARVGRRRRPLAARGVRPDDRVRGARAVQADRPRRGLGRRAGSGRPTSPARSARSSPARSSCSPTTYDAADAHRMGMVNRVVPHAQLEQVGLDWAARICRKSPTAQRMFKFAMNAHRRRADRPAGLRRRDDPPDLHDRRGHRGARRLPREAGPRLVRVPLLLLTRTRTTPVTVDTAAFIEFLVRSDVLTFGDFTTKSGRATPYFLNFGRIRTGRQIATLGALLRRPGGGGVRPRGRRAVRPGLQGHPPGRGDGQRPGRPPRPRRGLLLRPQGGQGPR